MEKLRADPGVYSVMIVDMTILGMPAKELVEKALQMEGDVRVIVTSGYPVKLPFSAMAAGRHITALQKPFSRAMHPGAIDRTDNFIAALTCYFSASALPPMTDSQKTCSNPSPRAARR